MESQQANQAQFNLLFLLGLGRSGSTLLGRLLSNHSDVVDVGELLRLERMMDHPSTNCWCGLPANTCPDWNRYLQGIPDKVKRNYKKWTPALLNHVRENAGAKVLVDVSKTRAYRLAKDWKDPKVGFVLLLRDPRGIFRSHVAERNDLTDRLKLHKKWITRFEAFAKKKKKRCLVMHYEDLMKDPASKMKELCDFIGIDFQEGLISPSAQNLHMASYSGSRFTRESKSLELDERWRQEISFEDISQISNALKSVPIYNNRYHLE